MPSSNPEAKNAAGLAPHESRSLKERKPELHEEGILDGIKQVLEHQIVTQRARRGSDE